jgi:formate-dependent nitrite reductase membrane component NrfD
MGTTIKAQRVWKWEIAIYLYLAGMGAGSFVFGIGTLWAFGPSARVTVFGFPIDAASLALLWGPVLVAVGAPFLILDLGIKRRFLYACLNPGSSWVARGFAILSSFIVLGGIVFLVSVLFPEIPPRIPTLWGALKILSVLLALGTAIYTGILLKSVKYIPIWNSPLLPVLFLASALSTGSMAVILSEMGTSLLLPRGGGTFFLLSQRALPLEQVLVLIEAVILALYLYSRYRAKDQGEASVRLLLSGRLRSLFWGGIVLIGFVFPLLLEYTYSCCPDYPVLLFTTGLLLLCGGFFLRLGVLASGVKETVPMKRLVEMKLNISAFKR